jgi:hypothetical protein
LRRAAPASGRSMRRQTKGGRSARVGVHRARGSGTRSSQTDEKATDTARQRGGRGQSRGGGGVGVSGTASDDGTRDTGPGPGVAVDRGLCEREDTSSSVPAWVQPSELGLMEAADRLAARNATIFSDEYGSFNRVLSYDGATRTCVVQHVSLCNWLRSDSSAAREPIFWIGPYTEDTKAMTGKWQRLLRNLRNRYTLSSRRRS